MTGYIRIPSWKTFKHSCGAVEPLMDHFIESGFDIINPVQINASGMDPKILKKKYGDKLVFWGGGVDTQGAFAFGTPAQVKEQVKPNVKFLMKMVDLFSIQFIISRLMFPLKM